MNRVCSLALFEESAECSLIWSVGKLYTELTRNRLDSIPTSWCLHNAPDRERTLFLQESSHGYVGRHHEAFDNIFGDIMFTDSQVFDLALIDNWRRFD